MLISFLTKCQFDAFNYLRFFFVFVRSEIDSFQYEKLTAITVLAKKLHGKRKKLERYVFKLLKSSCELMRSAMHNIYVKIRGNLSKVGKHPKSDIK